MWWLKFFIIPFLLISVSSSKDYKSYKVYEILSKTNQQRNLLNDLNQSGDYDFWSLTKAANRTAKVMVAPQQQEKFENILKINKFVFNIMHDDVSILIKNEFESRRQIIPRNKQSRTIEFDKYYSYDEINELIDDLVEKFPKQVSIFMKRKSYEGRDLKVLKITNGDDRTDKKTIFIDAGIHAREWIAPAGGLYIIDQLLNNFDENKKLLENYDWYIIPLLNPDGYEYSQTNNRFWRKTRQPINTYCSGTDGNRNFDFHWAETGTEIDPCSEIFHGTIPFSEPETTLIKDVLEMLEGTCKMYLTLHAFGKYLLYPWGWTSDLPSTWEDIDEVAKIGAAAIKAKTNEDYTIGSSTNVLYSASGGSDDYAFAIGKVPIAITIEMNGKHFIVEPELIKTYADECWTGVKAMAEKVIEKY